MTYNGYLFDTNIAIEMIDQKSEIIQFIKQAANDRMRIYFSVITECEFISGLKEENERNALKFLNSDRFIDVNSDVARLAGNIRKSQREEGRKVKTPDALIIATAIKKKLILVTNDRDMIFAEQYYDIKVISP